MKYPIYLLSFLYVIFCLVFFYVVGADRFPDYNNYIFIAKYGGVTGEKDYWFEWVSRSLLSADYLDDISRLYVTSFVNQILCVFIFLYLVNRGGSRALGVCFVVFIFYFLFLTTTIRASSAYLCIALFYVREKWLDIKSLLLIFFAVAWHDTAFVFVLLFFACHFLLFFRKIIPERIYIKIPFIIIFFSGCVFFLSKYIVMYAEDFFDFGSRADYLNNMGDFSLFKMIYFFLLGVFSWFYVSGNQISIERKYFIAFVFLCVIILSSFNQVAGVRFSFYLIIIILIDRGGVFINKKFNYILFAAAPLMIGYNIFGVLKNVG